MKIKYLGTAAAEGIPGLFCSCELCKKVRQTRGKDIRTRSSAIIDERLKLDFGPDSFLQMMRFDLDYSNLTNVLITHTHEDHLCIGELFCRLEGLSQVPDNAPTLYVYGNEHVGDMLATRKTKRLEFVQMYPFQPVEIDGYVVTPLDAVHCFSKLGNGEYQISFNDRLIDRTEQALMYLIEKDGQSILYAHDSGGLTKEDAEYLVGKKIDIISLDCTNGSYGWLPGIHMSAKANLELREYMYQTGIADAHTVFVANHFSHNGYLPYEEMEKILPGFIVSYDGLELETKPL